MAERFWTCQRRQDGQKCGHVNPKRKQICERCHKRRPATKQPAHRKVLEQPYEVFVAANGGREECGICGAKPTDGRRLDRDHDHRTGRPRGLLCHFCNRTLSNRLRVEWLRSALAYLERSERQGGVRWQALIADGYPADMSAPQDPQPPQQPDPNNPDQPQPQPAQDPNQDPGHQDQPEQQPEPTQTQG